MYITECYLVMVYLSKVILNWLRWIKTTLKKHKVYFNNSMYHIVFNVLLKNTHVEDFFQVGQCYTVNYLMIMPQGESDKQKIANVPITFLKVFSMGNYTTLGYSALVVGLDCTNWLDCSTVFSFRAATNYYFRDQLICKSFCWSLD